MRRLLPTVIDTKYEIINSRERRLAKSVAKSIVEFPQLSAWSFLIPIVFLYQLLGYKRRIEIITLNLLFTKKLSLEAARDMIKGQSREEVMARIEAKTQDILDRDKQMIYSEKVRREQMKEISILLDHYLKLLNAQGKSYESLVREAYHRREDYEAFLHQLARAEKAVNQAALQTVGKTEEAISQIAKMERVVEEIRRKEVKEIFS